MLLPPWKKHPEIPQGIGWRMGYGEGYLSAFDQWFEGLTEDQAAKFRTDNPPPTRWRDFYERYQR